MKTAVLANKKIQIEFSRVPNAEFVSLLGTVKTIPDRKFNGTLRVWEVPNTPWHSSEVVRTLKPLGFFIDPNIENNAKRDKLPVAPALILPEELYDYQREGVRFIYRTGGRAIVADDMGLGKTAEALVYVDQFGDKTLVVTPANVVFKWALKEVPMWAKGKTVQVITTGKQALEDRDITIMSYSIMVNKYEELSRIPFGTMVFDEAHYLKNPKAQRTRVAKSLVKGTPHVLFLSGTPFMNRRMELFSLLNMLDPKSWQSPIQFGVRYCGGKFQGGHWIVPPEGETNTSELKDRLSRIMLRRTKKEVALELPDLTRTSIPVEIENKREYQQAEKDVVSWARSQGKITKAHILAKLNILRQLVGQGKIKAAVELAEDILESGNQVVLFVHHTDVVWKLRAHLRSYGLGIISGETMQAERQRLVNIFLEGKIRVMIVTTAGAEGIDLYSASNIIFVEREWTPAKEEQIEARLHRNGQKNPVNAYYLVASGTVDEVLDNTVRSKRGEFGRVIDTDMIEEIWMHISN